jgi:hypothetical protein
MLTASSPAISCYVNLYKLMLNFEEVEHELLSVAVLLLGNANSARTMTCEEMGVTTLLLQRHDTDINVTDHNGPNTLL